MLRRWREKNPDTEPPFTHLEVVLELENVSAGFAMDELNPVSRLGDAFYDMLEEAIDRLSGAALASARRVKGNDRARKSVAELRSRRQGEALAAWNDGEVIDRTPYTVPLHDALPPGELRDRLETLGFRHARHVSTLMMRAPLILVPLEYTAVALGAWRAHLNRARTADEFVDGVVDAMQAKIAKRQAAKQRERQYRAEYYRRKRK
jgi:hypothetical protein